MSRLRLVMFSVPSCTICPQQRPKARELAMDYAILWKELDAIDDEESKYYDIDGVPGYVLEDTNHNVLIHGGGLRTLEAIEDKLKELSK